MNMLLPGGCYLVATEMYEEVPQDQYDKPYDRKDFISQLKALAAENATALDGTFPEVRAIDRAKDVSGVAGEGMERTTESCCLSV
jgi:hypothetical protein